MTSINKERGIARWPADIVTVPLAAGSKVFYGTLVAVNAEGFGVPGEASPGLTYVGAAEATVDNTAGGDGGASVKVRRPWPHAMKWDNDGSITQANFMQLAYIVDNCSVGATDGVGTRSAAGTIVGIESDGVWVQ